MEDMYILVTGGKGLGKSCLIQTTLHRKFGVIFTSTQSGQSKEDIVKKVQVEITNIRNNLWDLTSNTKRVLFFYKLIFRSSPIVVISVPERSGGRDYADVTSATRELTDKFGLRVIIDGSPNSIPPDLKATGREIVMDIDRMSRDIVEKIPEFEDLISFLKKHHLDDGVWEVFGGNPLHYMQLKGIKAEFSDSQTDSIVNEIKDYALRHLMKALDEQIVKSSPNTKAILNLFREKKATKIPKMELEAVGLQLDYPNKVFREVYEKDGIFVTFSSPAIRLIVSNGITDDIGVNKLWIRLFAK